MSPKAMGVHSNLSLSWDALGDGERSMEWDQVWSGLTSAGVIGGLDSVETSCAGHMISEGF